MAEDKGRGGGHSERLRAWGETKEGRGQNGRGKQMRPQEGERDLSGGEVLGLEGFALQSLRLTENGE